MHKSSHRLNEGYFVEIDGKFESEYGTITGASKAGLELRQKFPESQVKVHGVNEQAPDDDQSELKTETGSVV
jgi:hypothetical protein